MFYSQNYVMKFLSAFIFQLMEALTFNDDMRAVCLLSDYTPSMTDWGFAIGFGKTAGGLLIF